MKQKGFTLIEVMVAMMIMVGAIVILYASSAGTQGRIRKSRVYNNVALLLERKIAEVEAVNLGKSLTEISDAEGDFGKDYPEYRWTFATQAFEMPDMTAAVSRDGASQDLINILSQLSDVMSQSILEGTVTVYVNSGKKEVPFSVTTYFVDYNKEVSLPGFGGGGN